MKKQLTKKEFLKALNEGKRGYSQKPRSPKKTWYWWTDVKEKWFMNVFIETRKNSKDNIKPNLIISKEVNDWLNSDESNGLKFYINE